MSPFGPRRRPSSQGRDAQDEHGLDGVPAHDVHDVHDGSGGVWPDDRRMAYRTGDGSLDEQPLPESDSATSRWAQNAAAYLDSRLDVQDVVTDPDGTTVVVGELGCGTIRTGQPIRLERDGVLVAEYAIERIVGKAGDRDTATAGEFVAVRLSTLSDFDVRPGDAVRG